MEKKNNAKYKGKSYNLNSHKEHTEYLSRRKADTVKRSERNKTTTNVFKIILLVLLVVSVIAVLMSKEPKTFYGLLRILAEVPSVDFGWLDFGEVVLNLPEWLAWLEVVVGFFAELIQIIGFFLAGIGQALLFVLYFLRWLFL